MHKNHLVLIGLKHCGKSSIGRGISPFLQAIFYDLDEHIAKIATNTDPSLAKDIKNYPKIIRQLYLSRGKEYFQSLEVLSSQEICNQYSNEHLVIATGGGTMENKDAMSTLKKSGFIIFINVPKDILFQRIIKGGIPAFLDKNRPSEHFSEIYEHRSTIAHEWADLEIRPENQSLEELNALIIKQFKESGYAW